MPTATFVSFNPLSGGPGTRVNIFTDAEFITGLQLNNQPVQPETDFNTGGTFFRVPQNGTSGKVKLLYFGGSVTSMQTFMVTGTPVDNTPRITSFNPTMGPGNTRVNVIGENLQGTTAATIGGRTCIIAAPPIPGLVIIDLPGNAQTGRIVLSGTGFSVTSPTDFIVPISGGGNAPRIDSFFPLSGKAGDEITLTGVGFTNVSEAALSGTPAGFTPISDTSIKVRVPADTPSGKFSLTSPAGTGSSMGTFLVDQELGAPRIDGFNPTSGKKDDWITITGQNLGAVDQVTFNFTPASFTLMGNLQLQARVPDGATTGKLRVRNAAGTAVSALDFTVNQPPQKPIISTITPLSGKLNDPVTITGQFFTGTSAVLFVDQPAMFSVDGGSVINARVPSGFTKGKITITNAAGSTVSTQDFTFEGSAVGGPSISSVSPLSVQVNGEVTIMGTNLMVAGSLTQVLVGTKQQVLTEQTAGRLKFNVASGTTSGFVKVITANGMAQFGAMLTVATVAGGGPTVQSVSPASGVVGTEVTVTGTNLESTMAVLFGSSPALITSVSPTQVSFFIPNVTPQRATFVLKTGQGDVTVSNLLAVLSGTPIDRRPKIMSITPLMGMPGDAFDIKGMNFGLSPLVDINGRPQQQIDRLTDGLRFLVAGLTTTGKVRMRTILGEDTFPTDFTVLNDGSPIILGFNKLKVLPDDEVIVTGLNFDGLQVAKLGTTDLQPREITPTQFKFTVPMIPPGIYGLEVTTLRGNAISADSLEVLAMTSMGTTQVAVSDVQPAPEPDPLVDSDDEPDFEPSDTSALLRLVAGQSKKFRLIARRADLKPDTVVTKVSPTPPTGLRLILPGEVSANTPFDVTVETDPTFPPGTEYVFTIGGKGKAEPMADYSPFQLDLEVVAPVEYEVPEQVNVLSGASVEFNVTVIRRRFTGNADFTFPDVATHGITFTKTLLPAQSTPKRTKFKVKFVSDRLHVPTGLFNIAFMPILTGASFKAPNPIKLHLIEPNLSVELPIERNIKPGRSETFKYNFVPQDFRGTLRLVSEFVSLSQENQGKITTSAPILHDITSNDPVFGSLEVRVDPAAKEEDVNILLTLLTDLDEEVGRSVTLVARIANTGVEFVSDFLDFTVYPNLTAKINIDFKRSRNYTKDFIFKVTSLDSGLSVTFNGPMRVPPTSKGKTVNITPIPGYVEGNTTIRLEPLDPDSNNPVGDPVILTVRKRSQATLLRWDMTRFSIPIFGGSCSAVLTFRPPFDVMGNSQDVPLGPNELFQGTVFIRDRSTMMPAQQFLVYEKGNPQQTTITPAFFNNNDRRRFEFEIVDSALPTTGNEIFELVGLFQGTVLGPVDQAFVEVVVPLIYLGREGTSTPPPITKR